MIQQANGKAKVVGDRTRKPPVLPINVDGVPDALKLLDRCVNWSWTLNAKANGGKGKWDKPPLNTRTGGAGSSTDSSTWSRFDEAVAAQKAGRFDGVGFVLGECDGGLHVAGIDLDDCRDAETGVVAEWAMAIVNLIGSYTEISPSGTGLKILFLGKLPKCSRKVGDIECYDGGRYFTLTGRTIDGGPTQLRDATIEVEQFCQAYMTPPPANETGLSDAELATQALQALSPSRADDYWQWIQVGMAAKAAGVSLSEWEAWSASSGKYVDGECAKKWESFGRGGVGIGSLIHWARLDGWTPPVRPRAAFKLTDLGNAERFASQHGADARYCHVWGKWYVWDGRRWTLDNMGEIMRLAKRTVRAIYQEAANAESPEQREAIAKFAAASEKRDRINAIHALAQSQQPIPIAVESLDTEPWLLNVQNGTIDLRTGELREHRRDDFLTKICPVDYPTDAGCDPPLWLEFLDCIFGGNAELIRYLQCLVGSWLPGTVIEHLLPILFGSGANGKSVFINTICGALGSDYAMKAPPGFMMATKHEQHPTVLADLHGKRLVAAVETADGGKLSEVLAKELSGGDAIRARRMREDFWEFTPSHSLVLASNYKPTIRGIDHGIWRRVRLIPFVVTIPAEKQDKQLAEKLRDEWPEILRWAVAGCIEWQRNGLNDPPEVLMATESYKVESDTFKLWFDECCESEAGAEWKASMAYTSYRNWCEANNERAATNVKFSEQVTLHGFTKSTRRRDGYYYLGFQHLRQACEHN